jgi:hypothetical protein
MLADHTTKRVYWPGQKNVAWLLEARTDCDDYTIFIYNLARVAGVSAARMRVVFMQTGVDAWHLSLMFFNDGVLFAVEGTMYPAVAEQNFLRVPFFENTVWKNGSSVFYYHGIRWLWNEDEFRANATKQG